MSTQVFARRLQLLAQCFPSLTKVGKERCQLGEKESKVVTTFPGNFWDKASVWLPHKVMQPQSRDHCPHRLAQRLPLHKGGYVRAVEGTAASASE